eukprot:5645680-Pleurochrysis_carterae.AAC.1
MLKGRSTQGEGAVERERARERMEEQGRGVAFERCVRGGGGQKRKEGSEEGGTGGMEGGSAMAIDEEV